MLLKLTVGPTVNDNEILNVLRVDEKPLLETYQAIGLSLMAIAFLVIGGFVQVRYFLMI